MRLDETLPIIAGVLTALDGEVTDGQGLLGSRCIVEAMLIAKCHLVADRSEEKHRSR